MNPKCTGGRKPEPGHQLGINGGGPVALISLSLQGSEISSKLIHVYFQVDRSQQPELCLCSSKAVGSQRISFHDMWAVGG